MSVLIEDTLVTSLGHAGGKDYIRSSPLPSGPVLCFSPGGRHTAAVVEGADIYWESIDFRFTEQCLVHVNIKVLQRAMGSR